MAGDIKGITIALGADASDLTKALKESDSALRKTQRDLNDVNKGLKFNPQNVTLLTQKAGLLEDRIKTTKDSINTMKQALARMDAAGISKTSAEYQKLEREIVMSESRIEHFNAELIKTRAAASNIGQLGAKFGDIGAKATQMGQQLRAVSAAAAATAAAVGALAVKAGQWADELNTLSKVYSVSTKELQLYSAASQLVDVDTKTLLGSMQKMKKTMNTAASGSGAAAKAYEKLGVSVTDSNGNLRNSNEVFKETISALGKMKNETERDALAMQIFGKSAAQLNPLIEDSGKTYAAFAEALDKHGISFVDQDTLNKANEFNDALDRTKAVFQQSLMVAGTKLAAYLEPALERLTDRVMNIAGAISRMNPKVLSVVGGIAAAVGTIAPALLTFGALSKAIGGSLTQISILAQKVPGLATAAKALMGVLSANPIIAVAAALAALSVATVASGTDLDHLSDKIASAVATMAAKAAEIIPKVVEGITKAMPQIIQAAVQIILGLVTGIAKATPTLVANMPKIVKAMAQGIIASVPALATAGRDLIKGLWNGASAMVSWVVEKFRGLGRSILKGIKNALGIHSPSREFAQVGKFSVMGLANGITENLGIVDNAMNKLNNAMGVSSFGLNNAAVQQAPGASMAGPTSVVFNGSYTFMDRSQIEYFMQEAERLTRRRMATC